MFWGLVLEPEKRYSQIVQKPFHVSHAALDVTTGDGQVCQIILRTNGVNFILCSLQKGKDIQTPLDLYFKAGSDITFSNNGKCLVHLTGFMDPEFEEDEYEGESEEAELSEDEVASPVVGKGKENKRKLNSSAEESTSKKAKKEKQKQNGVQSKKKAAKPVTGGDSDSDDSSDDELPPTLQDLLAEDADSDELDDSYKPNETVDSGAADSDEDDDDEEEDDDDDDEDDDDESETEVPTLQKQDKKKNKQAAQPQQQNGIEKNKSKEINDRQQKKQKKKEEKRQQQNEKQQQPQRLKKTLSGGVHIEDLKVGDGPQVTQGKSVQVYYEGRLQSNNKMFDKHQNGPGFKFRVGSKEVISGWDVGVVGMKVGGRRKIICPPNMAYGTKGSPPVIPSNATLVFEVELKKVN